MLVTAPAPEAPSPPAPTGAAPNLHLHLHLQVPPASQPASKPMRSPLRKPHTPRQACFQTRPAPPPLHPQAPATRCTMARWPPGPTRGPRWWTSTPPTTAPTAAAWRCWAGSRCRSCRTWCVGGGMWRMCAGGGGRGCKKWGGPGCSVVVVFPVMRARAPRPALLAAVPCTCLLPRWRLCSARCPTSASAGRSSAVREVCRGLCSPVPPPVSPPQTLNPPVIHYNHYHIPCTHRPPPPDSVFLADQRGVLLRLVPVKEGQSLEMVWQVNMCAYVWMCMGGGHSRKETRGTRKGGLAIDARRTGGKAAHIERPRHGNHS